MAFRLLGMGDFKKLKIWHNAHEFTKEIYALTSKLPNDENRGLKSQLRRAAISCESNISEGEARYTDAAKINFLVDARSSAAEVQNQLIIVNDIYPHLSGEAESIREKYEILAKQINKLISFRRKNPFVAQKPNSPMT